MCRGGKRRDDQGRCVVSRNDKKDPSRPGDRDAQSRADHLSGRFSAGVNLPYQGGVFPGNMERLAFFITTR